MGKNIFGPRIGKDHQRLILPSRKVGTCNDVDGHSWYTASVEFFHPEF